MPDASTPTSNNPSQPSAPAAVSHVLPDDLSEHASKAPAREVRVLGKPVDRPAVPRRAAAHDPAASPGTPTAKEPFHVRYRDRIEIDPCYIWTGARDEDGYGRVSIGGRDLRAHRVACEEDRELRGLGPIPEGHVVDHLCNRPSCVRPEHLRVCTQAENIARRDALGRHAKGEGHGQARLTEEQVRALRELHELTGAGRRPSQRLLGRLLGISQPAVRDILRRRTWDHLR